MTDQRHPRVSALETRFAEIGEAMAGLPVYNSAVAVEAWGFRPHGDADLIGVLITPWFMNLVLLPVLPQPIEPNRYGEAKKIALPGGERLFLYGGDDAVGSFWAASLHSPMDVFVEQPQARAEARLRLAEVLTPPEPAEAPAARTAPRSLSRRALFTSG